MEMEMLMGMTKTPGFWVGVFITISAILLIIGIADHEIKRAYEKL